MTTNLVYQLPDLEPFQLSTTANDPLVFEKEVIHEGQFEKDGKKFSISASNMQHWVQTHEQMKSDGIKVVMPAEHTEDPEANRAEVLKLYVKPNSRGLKALYASLRFNDEQAARLKNSDVSIYVPEVYEVNGKKYRYPVKHIAFTDYPAITGLERFKALAASLVLSTGASKNMTIQQLADKIGVQGSVQMDDTAAETAIVAKVDELNKRVKDLEQMVTDLGGDPNAKPDGSGDAPPADGSGDTPPAVAASNATFRGILKDNRIGKLDKLVAERRITPAQKADLVKEHCSDQALELSLTKDDKSFDTIFNALSKNPQFAAGGQERTKHQLSTTRNEGGSTQTKNPLTADADARAAAAK